MSSAKKRPVPAPVVQIHAKKQPRRPHYLERLMELRGIDRTQMLREIQGLDKSQLSKWLKETDPQTPGAKWAERLGEYFKVAPDDDPVDIFANPDVDWLHRLLSGLDDDEIAQIKELVELFRKSRSRQ